MSSPATSNSSQTHVDVAFGLVLEQRRLLASTEVGSAAHRRAAEVLALIEESHFLLSETQRILAPAGAALPLLLAGSAGLAHRPSRRLHRHSVAIAFAAAFALAAFVLELADPAPMDLQAQNLRAARSAESCLRPRCPTSERR